MKRLLGLAVLIACVPVLAQETAQLLLVDTTYDDEGKRTQYKVYTYNSDGQRILDTLYNADGSSVRYFWTYEYNDEGLLTAKDWKQPMGSRIRPFRGWHYGYDEQGRMVLDSFFMPNLASVRKVTYDDQDRPVLDSIFDDVGTHTRKRVYEYADGSLNYSVVTYNVDSTGAYVRGDSTVYERNADTNVTKETFYDAENNETGYTTYTYQDGNRTEYLKYGKARSDGSDSLRAKRTYEYNDNGQRIKTSVYEGGDGTVLKEYTTHTYGEVGVIFGRMTGPVSSGYLPFSAFQVNRTTTGELQVGFTMVEEARMSMHLLDAAGRVVRGIADGHFDSGKQVINTTAPHSGYYFVRITAGEQSLVVPAVLW